MFKDEWGNIHQITQRNNFCTIVFNFSQGVSTAVSNNVTLLIPWYLSLFDKIMTRQYRKTTSIQMCEISEFANSSIGTNSYKNALKG